MTSDGRPFVHLDSEGLRDIVSPIYNALSIAPITSHNIMDFVRAKEPLNNNILEFYHSIKFRKPHLYKLALTVLATPATQVSVERAFSALNFILTEKRNKLSQENLNSLLVVKLNS